MTCPAPFRPAARSALDPLPQGETPVAQRMSRRTLLTYLAAGLGGAAVYKGLEYLNPLGWAQQPGGRDVYDVSNPEHFPAGCLYKFYEKLGRWILLAPEKLGGGSHAVDLS